MSNISAIISTFSSEDKREFLNYQKKKNRRGDAKNITLFKLIDQGRTTNLDVKIYGKPARNSYHALCKRLQDSLITFVAEKSFMGETSEEMQVMKLLLASRIFFEHKKTKIAFKTLEKAEKNALENDLYSILGEIYQTKIQYAHLHSNAKYADVVEAAIRNQELQQRELRLNMAYASIKDQLSQRNANIEAIIDGTFQEHGIAIDDKLTYKSLFQLLQILSTSAQLRSDYGRVMPQVNRISTIVNKKKKQAGKHLFYHIQILNLMAVISFRNKDFTRSKDFIQMMELEMTRQERKYYRRFAPDLVLLKALNLNFTGNPSEAITMLKAFHNPFPELQLALVMCLFQQDEFKEAQRQLRKLNHSDLFYEKKVGIIWVIQKNIIELLVLIELDQLDLVLSRINSIRKKLVPKLRRLNEDRAVNFLKLVGLYYNDPTLVRTLKFREKVEESFEWKDAKSEDIFVMSFYAWLKAKMEDRPIYEVTLELVSLK